MARRRSTRRPGLTLLEVLLVMVLLIILSVVAYPTLSAMYGDVRVKAAADQVQGAWAEARSRAIEDGRAYRFSVEPGTGKFRVAPDSAEFWDGGNSAGSDDEAPAHIQEGELTSQIKFDVPEDLPSDGTWTIVAIFNPDGTCKNDTEITLRENDDEGTPIVVRVRALTGAITVRKQSTEGQ